MTTIRLMREEDIPEATRILRLAFGTFGGAPDPENQRSDVDFVSTRWRTHQESAFVAEVDGQVMGSNFATHWGSFAFFGPLTVHPQLWEQGIGQQLMQPVLNCFEKWKVTQAGLFTFPESPKHIALYQKFGFWPRFLTALMTKQVQPKPTETRWSLYSVAKDQERRSILESGTRITEAVFPGLRLEREIHAVHGQNLGDTVLLWNDEHLTGFAVCHCGRDTEAGEDKCYIKFAAVQPGVDVAQQFKGLLAACEQYAASRTLLHVDAGVNLSRHEAYQAMLDSGFRIERPGLAMHRPNEPAFSRPGLFVIDDWR